MNKKDYSKLSKKDLLKVIEKLESRKKYGLVWDEDKTKEQFEREAENALPVLKEAKNKGIVTAPNKPFNILIEGDNFHALSVLNYTHQEKIDVVYIDPPYNTGNKDFIYNDNFVNEDDAYRHSKWLSFMSKRLVIAKNLLSKDGVLFISIDNNEIAQLKMLCDQIMPNGFVTILHAQMSTVQGQKVRAAKSGNIVKNAEYILVYSKSGNKTIGRRTLYDPTEYDNHYSSFLVKQDETCFRTVGLEEVLVEKFKKELETMGLLSKTGLSKSKIKDAYRLSSKIRDFIHKNAQNIVRKHTAIPVKLSKQEAKKVSNGLIVRHKKSGDREYLITRDNKGGIAQIIQLEDKIKQCHDFYGTKGVSTIRGDWWPGFYLDMGNVAKEGGIGFANGKKPIRLIKQLIYFTAKQNSIVLDFFAGSGSTGHAVADLNQNEEGFNLQYILCTHNSEVGKEKIVDKFCYPRLKNMIKGKGKLGGLGGNLKYFKTAFVKGSISQDSMKMRITRECTEMLCLREGVFNSIKERQDYRIFQNNGKIMGIYYAMERDSLKELKKELDCMEGEKVLYCFTLDPLGLEEQDFSDWQGVSLEAIPQPILDIYKKIYRL